MGEAMTVREVVDHWLEMIETAIEDGQETVAYVHIEHADCQMLCDEFAQLTGELCQIADIAGEAIGTHPDLRAPLTCVQALANYHEQVCEDLRNAQAEIEVMRLALAKREAEPTTITASNLPILTNVELCPHGRPGGWLCPHCIGSG